MSLETRTKEVPIDGVTYKVREPSAAEFSLFMKTRIEGNDPKGITVAALEAEEQAQRIIFQRCVISPPLTEAEAAEIAADSVRGVALMATIMGLGVRGRDKDKPGKGKSPQKKPDAA